MGDDRTAGASVVDKASLSVQVSESFINVGTDGNGKLNDRNGATVNINDTTGFGFLGVGRNANGNKSSISKVAAR